MCANLASDGFFYDELSDYRKKLLHETADLFPDETENFLKDCAKEASKIQKRIARSDVGTSKGKKKKWTAAESYHKRFKVGKIYLYEGARAIRAYNSAARPFNRRRAFCQKRQICARTSRYEVRGQRISPEISQRT